MNQYLKMTLFVLIMALITSSVLLGVEALTADRIQANQDAKVKSAVLDANGIAYSITNINETFDAEIEIIELEDWVFYLNPDTGAVSFNIEGGGVWGPIEGILTLESDFETILNVTILQQEETPGLGGVIAESQYLATFVGKVMVPRFEINKDTSENAIYEIDSITGATNTSKRFETLINEDYLAAKAVWNSRNE
ncbi:MAG: FMN-binding protein [Candidatus Izemoplasmatales bacterium]|uniref:FMN-binding protein n=1 Tax=Hujiaoplasma nucleasis TaxID=2725268 RepID=A0A7L6N3B7_9MOLU|nr:FMN-binding protein [Hujiaoplasma nucleasis]QLY40766.1 FMN-binding protein [Hujiaoplasma nucleasis]